MVPDARAVGLTCREFIDFIVDYREGALPEGVRRRFDRHLEDCPDCVSYLGSYAQTVELQARACDPSGTPPESVPGDLITAILDAQRRTR